MDKREELLDELKYLNSMLFEKEDGGWNTLMNRMTRKRIAAAQLELDNLPDPLVSGWIEEAEARAADYADLKRTEEDARGVGLR